MEIGIIKVLLYIIKIIETITIIQSNSHLIPTVDDELWQESIAIKFFNINVHMCSFLTEICYESQATVATLCSYDKLTKYITIKKQISTYTVVPKTFNLSLFSQVA